MSEKTLENLVTKVEGEYRDHTPNSFRMHENAKKYMPGGDTRSVCFFNPYPLYFQQGDGAYLFDVDGNRYLDLINNYAALVHGHAYPPVVESLSSQVKLGTVWSGYSEYQIQLAEIICNRVPSIEKIRFCNSGSEATMGAVWAARAYTSRSKIVKVEGGYHGSADMFRISVHPPMSKAGPAERPISVPELGVPEEVTQLTIVAPFNNVEATQKIIDENNDQIAAFIIEPQLGAGGQIPATQEYLEFVREITRRYGIVLIFDEVQSFRLSVGGAQELYKIKPDLTALGKIIGGGLAIGAFGGQEEIMNIFSPLRANSSSHSGTFNGNPLTMLAGFKTMEYYSSDAVDYINGLSNTLRDGLQDVLEEIGINAQITGLGSLLQFHCFPNRVFDYRSSGSAHTEAGMPYSNIVHLLFLGLANRGVFCAKRGMFCPSTVMNEEEIQNAILAFRESFEDILPYVHFAAPELLKK